MYDSSYYFNCYCFYHCLRFWFWFQNSKGGGLAAGFSSTNQIMGVRKTTDFLEKATWGLSYNSCCVVSRSLLVYIVASLLLQMNLKLKSRFNMQSKLSRVWWLLISERILKQQRLLRQLRQQREVRFRKY